MSETPLMKQFYELKKEAGEALLLFRMGDFYELFGDDAIVASKILEITLTSRDKNKPNPIPMAGVPHHSVQSYLQKLLRAGKKVAIGEQVGDPATTKGIVKREITRIFTPAVNFENESKENIFVATLIKIKVAKNDRWILACLDPTTGEVLLGSPQEPDEILEEIRTLEIRHFLNFGHQTPPKVLAHLEGQSKVLKETLPKNYLSTEQADQILQDQYKITCVDPFFPGSESKLAVAILATYVARTQRAKNLEHLRLPSPIHQSQTLRLGPKTAQHLNLVPHPGEPHSLFELIDSTKSAMGGRQLRRWILEPLKNASSILERQKGVQALSQTPTLPKLFSGLYDLERITGKVNAGLAGPRDTLALGRSIGMIPSILRELEPLASNWIIQRKQQLEKLNKKLGDLGPQILKNQREPAPLVARDGGIFNKGVDPDLDRLIQLTEEGENWLIELEQRERKATSIPSLKVRYNRVFGYYIEVTKTHLKNVPKHYQRKQSRVSAERFFTDELKKFEDEILSAEAKRKHLETKLFEDLIKKIRSHTQEISETGQLLAELDALCSLGQLCSGDAWSFPKINEGKKLRIEAGRHPLVDSKSRGEFVPNDLEINPEDQNILLITGPNMGGKSTVMRQAAMIVLLGQMGAPVPAQKAEWGAFSSIFTRIGAHDAIAEGQSTFMVEMSELAYILHNADDRSLIILDEIGRGTSTYDGMSIAWSTLEWISQNLQSRTLFATHYHELTTLPDQIPTMANFHMAVEETQKNLRFLYRLAKGAVNQSYGIQVAKMAGIPTPVIKRSWQVMKELQKTAAEVDSVDRNQLSLFEAAESSSSEEESSAPEPHPVMSELNAADLNSLTPLEALNLLARLQESSRESGSESA